MEPAFEFADPLLDEVRGAEHGKSLNVATIKQLTRDERGLYRLANTHIVGDEQPNRVKLECHEKWHELVGARLYRNLPEAAERTSASTQ